MLSVPLSSDAQFWNFYTWFDSI